MKSDSELRYMLVDSWNSGDCNQAYFESRLTDAELLKELVGIAVDAEGYLGDVPGQAAYWISRYPTELIAPYEGALLSAFPNVEGDYSPHIAVALGRIRSLPAKQAIIDELGDGSRYDAWLFRQALEYYEQPGSTPDANVHPDD